LKKLNPAIVLIYLVVAKKKILYCYTYSYVDCIECKKRTLIFVLDAISIPSYHPRIKKLGKEEKKNIKYV
jgi:hypothetical protein